MTQPSLTPVYTDMPQGAHGESDKTPGVKNTGGRTRVTRISLPCESPRHLNLLAGPTLK